MVHDDLWIEVIGSALSELKTKIEQIQKTVGHNGLEIFDIIWHKWDGLIIWNWAVLFNMFEWIGGILERKMSWAIDWFKM